MWLGGWRWACWWGGMESSKLQAAGGEQGPTCVEASAALAPCQSVCTRALPVLADAHCVLCCAPHLIRRQMTYKFLNTIIDDLFAFVIKMPLLHRLSGA